MRRLQSASLSFVLLDPITAGVGNGIHIREASPQRSAYGDWGQHLGHRPDRTLEGAVSQ